MGICRRHPRGFLEFSIGVDLVSITGSFTSCSRLFFWQEMLFRSLQRDVVSFTTAASACQSRPFKDL